ncbi:MAG TPA: acyl carrier protein [Verrucomicrobiae bacterium]
MIARRNRGRVYLQSFMDALITFSTFWVFLFVFVLVQQTDSRSQMEAIGAALFYSCIALAAVMLHGFRTVHSRPDWWAPTWEESHKLSSHQVLWVALALAGALLAVGDMATSRVFLAAWLLVLYGCLLMANRFLPQKIIETVYEGRREFALLLMNGEVTEGVKKWRTYQEKIGVGCIEYLPDFSEADLVAIARTVEERNVTRMVLMRAPEERILRELVKICDKVGAGLMVGGDPEMETLGRSAFEAWNGLLKIENTRTMGWFSNSKEKEERLERFFSGREPLDDSQLWESYFKNVGVALDTVAKVRRILSDVLEVDLLRIRDKDDFSKELAFFWDLDSMADVEVVQQIEKGFDIAITDSEAEAMKTLRDIVLLVHTKITGSSTGPP